jgi:signal transduction histidine kinase
MPGVRHTASAVVAVSCLAAAAAGEATALVLAHGMHPLEDSALWAFYNLSVVAFGALILVRLRDHPVGWVLCVGGVVGVFSTDVLGAYGLRAEAEGWPGAAPAQWLALSAWSLGALMWVWALLFIPTGRLPSRRWRIFLYAGAVGVSLYIVGWLTSATSINPTSSVANPFVVAGLPSQELAVAGGLMLAIAGVAAMASMLVRVRGADVITRQQLKWVAVATGLIVTFLPIGLIFWSVSPVVRVLSPLVLLAAVAALAAAVLRYRLFDLDRLALRAAGYAVATAVGVALYAASTVTLGALLGGSRPWHVAAATLIAAAAFRPVARAAQRIIDRRFDRYHDAWLRLDRYLDGLRSGAERIDRLEQVLREAVNISELQLLIRLPASDGYVDVRGHPRAVDPTRPDVQVGSVAEAEAIVQYPDPYDPELEARIERLLRHSRLALMVARLSLGLSRQVSELEESRRRIASASDTERRRIQRDLHDGAQQNLVTIGLAMRSLEGRLRNRNQTADADVLDVLVAELQATIEGLRALVSDLPLPQLDAGIDAAFRELADRSPIPVRVEVETDRLDAALEATAYFVGSEGLTNVLKHAHASEVTLRAWRVNGSLLVSVSDDGIGGADPQLGSGLLGLRDRIAAVGGRLSIDSDAAGTRLTAELPCV